MHWLKKKYTLNSWFWDSVNMTVFDCRNYKMYESPESPIYNEKVFFDLKKVLKSSKLFKITILN